MSKEMEVNRDVHSIIHCLATPAAKDDSDAEFERMKELSSAIVGWQIKYGSAFVDDLWDRVNDVVCEFCDRALHESEV